MPTVDVDVRALVEQLAAMARVALEREGCRRNDNGA